MEGVDLIEPHQAEVDELEPLNDIPSIYIVPRNNSPGGSAAESWSLGLHPFFLPSVLNCGKIGVGCK